MTPVKKVMPVNNEGVPFGPGMTWQAYEDALLIQWDHVDDANRRFDRLREGNKKGVD